MSTIGIIDIGSNTFNLLVSCTDSKKTLYSKEEYVGIRQGTKKNIIQKKTISASIFKIKKFKKICKKLNCEKIYLIATASLRNALNKTDFIATCKKETNLIINVISGDNEAKLIFDGITNNIKELRNFVIVDIGGASTEFIITKNKKSIFSKSYSFGSQLLIQKFNPSKRLKEKEEEEIYLFFKKELQELILLLKKHSIKNVIGSSGSFNCITNIELNQKYDSNYHKLNIENYKTTIAPLILNSTVYERTKIAGLEKMRAENIIITIILINFLMDNKIKNIYTTKLSLNEGVFLNILNKLIPWQESLL